MSDEENRAFERAYWFDDGARGELTARLLEERRGYAVMWGSMADTDARASEWALGAVAVEVSVQWIDRALEQRRSSSASVLVLAHPMISDAMKTLFEIPAAWRPKLVDLATGRAMSVDGDAWEHVSTCASDVADGG